MGSIWKYFELETWNFGLKSADSASLRNSSRTIDLLVDEPEIWLRRNKAISIGCGQIGECNKSILMVVVDLVASTDFDSYVQRFKVIAYLIIIQKLQVNSTADWINRDSKKPPYLVFLQLDEDCQ